MRPDTKTPGDVPGDFVATVGGTDGSMPPPWRASYVISVSVSGGVRFMYAIDHAAVLPWCWRVPVGAGRTQVLARLVLSCGILTPHADAPDTPEVTASGPDYRNGVWLCASAGSIRRALPLHTVASSREIGEAFRGMVPEAVWRRVAERRIAFVAAHQDRRLRGPLRGTLGGEGR